MKAVKNDLLTNFQNFWVAEHEAGHAVAALAFGIGVTKVTIRPNFDQGSAGACSIKGGAWWRARSQEMGSWPASQRLLLTALAGMAASLVTFEDAEEEARESGVRDLEWVREHLEILGFEYRDLAPDRVEAVVNRLLVYARFLTERLEDDIQRLAQALLKKETLKARDIFRLFDDDDLARIRSTWTLHEDSVLSKDLVRIVWAKKAPRLSAPDRLLTRLHRDAWRRHLKESRTSMAA